MFNQPAPFDSAQGAEHSLELAFGSDLVIKRFHRFEEGVFALPEGGKIALFLNGNASH